jgi:hypothetical protein
MRTFIFLIGSTDDFESLEHLENAYNNGSLGEYNAAVYKFQLGEDCGTDTMTVRDIATYIGRGLAFSSDWFMDDSINTLIEME